MKVSYLDVNSASRNRETVIKLGDCCNLKNNALKLVKNEKKIYISHQHHKFKTGQLVYLNNVSGKNAILRTYDSDDNPTVSIEPDSNLLKIAYVNNFITNDLEVEIHGIKSDSDTSGYLGSIPINLINCKHKIAYCNPEYFLVELPIAVANIHVKQDTLKEYNFKIAFNYVGGIPISSLNKEHVIVSTDEQGYEIELECPAATTETGGGSKITVAEVLDIRKGYEEPNKYVLDIGHIYSNVCSIQLISSEFPNVRQNITLNNNKFIWYSLDDGDNFNSCNIKPGFYSQEQICSEIANKLNKSPRLHFRVTNNNITKIITIICYKKNILIDPFKDIVINGNRTY